VSDPEHVGSEASLDLGALNESLTSLDRAVRKDVRVSDGIQENVRVPKQTFAYLQSKCGLAPAGEGWYTVYDYAGSWPSSVARR
jgi:hypothetical protein